MSEHLIQVKNITKKFSLDSGFFARQDRFVYAVNDVSFSIKRGETYGLVGESGCGKTTTARLIIQMYRQNSGEIIFTPEKEEGSVVFDSSHKTSSKVLRSYREKVKYIFQDPGRSLNPRMTVFNILQEAYRHSSMWPGKKIARQEASKLMEEVGLDPSDLDRRPAEFSGGQRQRISIARGLIMKPELLICDEVVSALDVSVQGQILNLLHDLKASRNLSFLFIAHDLRVSCYFCDTIGVMYSGMLLEEAPGRDLYLTAMHPYTKLLFSGTQKQNFEASEVKTVLKELSGCPFAHRCPLADDRCRNEIPDFKNISENHKVRCHKI